MKASSVEVTPPRTTLRIKNPSTSLLHLPSQSEKDSGYYKEDDSKNNDEYDNEDDDEGKSNFEEENNKKGVIKNDESEFENESKGKESDTPVEIPPS